MNRARVGTTFATVLLVIGFAFNLMDRMVLAVLAQPIKEDLGISDAQLGLLTGFAFVAVYAAAGLPLARLADRIGRRRVLAGSIGFWSLMTAACGFAGSFWQLALARVGVGMGEAGGMPASVALLAEMYPPHRRILPVALLTVGSGLGIAMGMSLGGIVAAQFGWRAAFLFAGLPGLVLAAMVWLLMPEAPRPDPAERSMARFWPTVGLLLRTPTYRRLVGGFVFYNICTTGFAGWVPTFLMRSHGMQVQHVGPAFGLSYAFGAAAGAVAGALLLQNASWATPQRALRYAGVLMIAALPVFACGLLVSSSYLAIGLFMVYGLLTGAASGPLIAMQQNVVSGQHRALAAALSGFFVGYIGGGLGPLVLGMGSDLLAPSMGVHSLRGTLLAASAAIVVSGAFLLAASRSYVADAAGQGNSTR